MTRVVQLIKKIKATDKHKDENYSQLPEINNLWQQDTKGPFCISK